MDVVERLNRDLEMKEEKIGQLESKLSEMEEAQEDRDYQDEWRWRHIRTLTPEENMGLPFPRLELRRIRKSEYSSTVHYGLVNLHLDGSLMFYPFSSVMVGGKTPLFDTPFRSGGDILNDMYELNLRGFVIDEGKSKELSLDDKGSIPNGLAAKMEKG